MGSDANEREKKRGQELAKDYVKLVAQADGRNQTIPITRVTPGKEPPAFTANFHGWDATPAEKVRLSNLRLLLPPSLSPPLSLSLCVCLYVYVYVCGCVCVWVCVCVRARGRACMCMRAYMCVVGPQHTDGPAPAHHIVMLLPASQRRIELSVSCIGS
jgi:hypothetical protein